MKEMIVLNSAMLLSGRNGQLGSHRFLAPNPVPCSLRSDRPKQVGHCPLPSLDYKSSLVSWRQPGQTSLLKSRKGNRNFALKIAIPPTETSVKESALDDYDIDGEVILQKVSLLNFTDYSATIVDEASELRGKRVYLQLVSGDKIDPETGSGKTASEPTYLEWKPWDGPVAGDTHYPIKFKWNASLGFPGAFLIKNMHAREFFLKSLTLFIPGQGDVRFHCNSWIAPSRDEKKDRVFFSNKSFLPEQTPVGLRILRELDLVELRGDGKGERKVSDRIYDYDVYNDIGDPDKDPKLRREVLGGSKDFPYPRRCRTGRPPTKTAPEFESRVSFPDVNFIPPDERFPHTDFSDFGAHALNAVVNMIIPTLANLNDYAYQSFLEIEELYIKGFDSPLNSRKHLHSQKSPLQIIQGIVDAADDSPIIKFSRPQIMQGDDYAWRNDEEFARQTLAGVNPIVIESLQKFPPSSSLDEKMYGPQQSAITAQHIEKNLEGLSVNQAVTKKRLFILDYYDAYMPYVERVNKLSDDVKMYASRMLLFLTSEGTLIPVAIELCLPPTDGKEAVRKVFTPGRSGTEEGALWLLAKAHARVNDAGVHQLVSHWLETHCITEPIIIATHRQLSSMHPLFKLLHPHFLDTMDINQSARSSLINAGGVIEQGFTTGKYSMEISSKAYKNWKFNEQGLPADLLKRGMAVPDPGAPHGLRLLIEDYPYAVDGLELWFALKEWVSDYLSLYYKDSEAIHRDKELQAWWDEIVNVGHGDLKDDPTRWYKMDSLDELVEAVTTIIWTTSAHHAAVNFGQYSYGGYMPNLPTMSRCFIPEKGTPEYEKLLKNPDAYFLDTVSTPTQATLIMAVLEILSKHANDEVYLGQVQGSTMDATDDDGVEKVFENFSANMVRIERDILERNTKCDVYKNRYGPAKVAYTLLYPNTSDLSKEGGVTGRGVPNSISI
uniref:Lipoxygenase n=1 Tax=Wollemia nobilis TaxID=56998 RepID=A0A0C9S647_9CONI